MGRSALLCGGMGLAAACAGALGQGCPPGQFQYGPVAWDPEVEQIVIHHYGAPGPLIPAPDDYVRAERDVGLIRALIPGLGPHVGWWEHRVLMVTTDSLTVIPKLTCTNAHFQASMQYAFGMTWRVEFPRAINIPALADLYRVLPEVVDAGTNALGSTSCSVLPTWLYEPQGGAWRWSITDVDFCGPGVGACCATTWDVEVSESGVVQVLCGPADCNGNGHQTIHDFVCFQTRFAAGDPWADCNKDGLLTVQDFGCFQTAFAAFVAGCP